MAWKFIAQRVATQQFLDLEVPFTLGSNPRRDLSGPGGMNGTIAPEYARLVGPDGEPIIQEWSTALYAEVDGRIRWGGLVSGSSFSGGTHNIECVGFAAYPQGIPYLGRRQEWGKEVQPPDPFAGKDRNNDGFVDDTDPPRSQRMPPPPPVTYTAPVDAFDVVRLLWNEVQRHPYGDIGMQVDKHLSGQLLGVPRDTTDVDGKPVKEADPYNLLWWEFPDCGGEIDNIAGQVRFDYIEDHDWAGPGPIDAAGRPWGHPDHGTAAGKNRYGVLYTSLGMDDARRPKGHPDFGAPAGQDKDGVPYPSGTSNGQRADMQIVHRLRLAHPRLGRRRTDLSFVQGENVTALATPSYRGGEFANEIIGVGKGEGSKMLVTRIPNIDGRLRRVAMHVDKLIGSKARLDSKVREELGKRAQGLHVPMIEVRDHPNARIGSWQPGDDVLVEVSLPWVGRVSVWHRVVSDEIAVGDTALLTLVRSDVFA